MYNKKYEEEVDELIDDVINQLKVLRNHQRREILDICTKTPKSISELKRILKASYKIVFDNVKILEKSGFLKLDKKTKEKHQPVMVSSGIGSLDCLLSLSAQLEVFQNDLFKLKNRKNGSKSPKK